MYSLDLMGLRKFIDSKKRHIDAQDELNVELQDERDILYKYVEELRSNEETKYIVPSELALAVYEPEKNELTKMLNQNFKEILKKIKEKAHLYSYFVYVKRYILTKLSINSLSYEFDKEMALESKSKHELIKDMIKTINLDIFEVKTINDSLPLSQKENEALEALMVRFQSIIDRHLITKEDLWTMIKTYKLDKDLIDENFYKIILTGELREDFYINENIIKERLKDKFYYIKVIFLLKLQVVEE